MSEPTTWLRPEHLGEPLVAALLAQIAAASRAGNVPVLRSSSAPSFSAQANLATALAGLVPPLRFVPDAQLAPILLDGVEVAFDGKSTVDVAVLDAAGSALLIELKLGATLLAAKAFTKRLLRQCSVTHAGRRLSGKMCAVLDGRFPPTKASPLLAVRHGSSTYWARSQWGIVVRRATGANWARRGWPAFERCGFVVSLEDLAVVAGGRDVFDKLVAELIGQGSFADRWGIA